ncbi:MAG: diacylglycerol kinase family lipid kinase, partial [Actinomycetota bacterium]|nr:diacylglycerol kinase family lipid kinase [Actinomycetota bacterium]
GSSQARKQSGKSAGKKQVAKKQAKFPATPRVLLVVNPVAGAGRARAIWSEFLQTIKEMGFQPEFVFTKYARHGIELSKNAAEEGFETVVSVGGDGTTFEVINGLMSANVEKKPRLGIVPLGRGSDFCRTIGLPQDWKSALAVLMSGRRRMVDVGAITYKSSDSTRDAYFLNIAGLGFDGEVTERANNMPREFTKLIGGSATYVLGAVVTFAKYFPKDIEIELDEGKMRTLATMVVVANGRYFGGNMRIAPDAILDDGFFDVVIVKESPDTPLLEISDASALCRGDVISGLGAKARMAKNFPRIYKGTHVKDRSVVVKRSSKVKVSSPDRLVLQVDGEVIGEGPLEARIIPSGLEIIA